MKEFDVIPVVRELPADLLTPVAAFMRLSRPGRPACLLESVEGGERLARYSFIAADPHEVLWIEDGKLRVRGQAGRIEEIAGNPFWELGHRLQRYQSDPRRVGLPPFTGGAVGYVGYECAKYLEDIPSPPLKTGPYDAHLMVFRNLVAFDHVRQRVLLIANLFLREETRAAGLKRVKRELDGMQKRLLKPSPREVPFLAAGAGLSEIRPAKAGRFKPYLGEKEFSRRLLKIRGHIRQGDIFQCVLSDQFRFELKAEPFSVYRALRTVSPAPYLYYLSMGKETLLGASPEMLVKVGHGKIETCPIAGTRPRDADPTEDRRLEKNLLASVKERAEHLMLVDLGRNDLGRVSKPGSVKVNDFMHVERFSHVMHLVSNVEGQLKTGLSGWDALAACFPAGTLSGSPKIRAMEILAGLEPVQRNVYGGAVIYHDFSGRLDACITIRSLFLRGREGVIQAGAGVVADSQPAREYEEVRNKTLAVRRAVELAERARAK